MQTVRDVTRGAFCSTRFDPIIAQSPIFLSVRKRERWKKENVQRIKKEKEKKNKISKGQDELWELTLEKRPENEEIE